MSKFTSTKVINTRWRNNDFVGGAGSSHTFPDAFHEEFLVDWALQIADGSIIITETPTTGNIQVSTLTVGDIVLTGTATGNFGAGGATIIGTSPISVATASGTSTISLSANYQTAGTYVTSVTGTAPITTSGTTAITVGIDQTAITGAVSATNASVLRAYVKNSTGTTLNKGQVVYVSGSDGANALISLSTASTEAGSSKTLGLLAQTLLTGEQGYVIENGLLVDIDTSAATAGQAVWLGNTPGSFVFGSPPAEPSHSVYLGVVTRVQQNNGEILVKVQNGYELDELHDVSAASPSDGDIIQYKTSSSLWTKASIANAGIAASVHTHAYQPFGTYITAVNGTAPIVSSTDTAGIVSVSLTATYSSSTHDHSGVYQPSGNYASSIHTHGTSDVTSGNFVATLAAGTGVTVTGADANAAAKTVAIGQAVATSDNVTFANLTATGTITGSSSGHSNVLGIWYGTRTAALSLSTSDGSAGTVLTYSTVSGFSGADGFGAVDITQSSGVFTVPVAGFYQINATVAVQGGVGAYRMFVYTGSTGGTKLIEQEGENGANTTRDFVNINFIHKAAANDTFRIIVSSTAASRTILAAGPNKVTITYLGDAT